MIDRRSDILRHFRKLLARWHGATARLFELKTSHRSLTVQLFRPDEKLCLHVIALGPVHVHAPIEWTNAHVGVELTTTGFSVTDVAADATITCESVEVKEFPWAT
jgi:hypothetical protein